MPRRRRVGLLTGTFDPVHLGHVAMARAAMSACELDEVWFLANPDPSHKQGVSALVDRVAMLRLAVAGETGLREGEPAGGEVPVRHTIADFERLMARYSGTEFVFIVGADVLATLDSWDEADRARSLEYAAARRAGAPEERLGDDLKVTWFDLAEHAGASSRRIQAQLRDGKRPAELDDGVYGYIREHGLYGAMAVQESIASIRERVDSIADKLGMPIDPGIKETVVAIQAHGLATSGSCEGHFRNGVLSIPWVAIETPQPLGWRTDEALQSRWKEQNLVQRDKLAELLFLFNQGRDTDLRLELRNRGIFGAIRLEPLVDREKFEPDDLRGYQGEMKAFSAFLLGRLT